jgi:ribosomal protein L37AE/L43A
MEDSVVNEGDTSTAYCNNCQQETEWTLIQRVFHNVWKCLICGGERVASNRMST